MGIFVYNSAEIFKRWLRVVLLHYENFTFLLKASYWFNLASPQATYSVGIASWHLEEGSSIGNVFKSKLLNSIKHQCPNLTNYKWNVKLDNSDSWTKCSGKFVTENSLIFQVSCVSFFESRMFQILLLKCTITTEIDR